MLPEAVSCTLSSSGLEERQNQKLPAAWQAVLFPPGGSARTPVVGASCASGVVLGVVWGLELA